MDVFQTVSGYITKMVTAGDSAAGPSGAPTGSLSTKMKILLLDRETVPIVSTAATQSALLTHGVYLIDRLDNAGREKMRHLRCYCFVRPSAESVQLLVEELRDPRYGEYNLFFSNVVKKSSMERLAEADDHEVVKRVHEYFADFVVVNPDLFTLDWSGRVWGSSPDAWNTEALQRSTEGVLAALLALKKKPLIRYARSSLLAKKLATEVRYRITQEEQALFDFRAVDTPPILLILDRREDPVTPLLTQWTYQAMVHQLFGIRDGRVNLEQGKGRASAGPSASASAGPSTAEQTPELVLSQDQDPFFKKNMFLNFGDLGSNVKDYVEQFQAKHKNSENLESIADMKRFVEEYPEFRKLSGNVSKHVHLISELSRRVGEENLLEVSECEQSLACNDNHAADLRAVQRLIQDPKVTADSKVGLVALYALRYGKQNTSSGNSNLAMLVDLLGAAGGVSGRRADRIAKVVAYQHSLQRAAAAGDGPGSVAELFESSGIGLFAGAGAKALRGLKGVDNVYTMHTPLLETTLQSLIKGRLREQQYPFVDGGGTTRDKPQDIVVFMVGGTTYEEAKAVAGLNASTPGVRIVLGGTTIHNAASFWDEVDDAVSSWPEPPPTTVAGRLRKEIRGELRREGEDGGGVDSDGREGHVCCARALWLPCLVYLSRLGCWPDDPHATASNGLLPASPVAFQRIPPSPTSPATSPDTPRENIYTLPNILTVVRLAAAPAIGYLIVHDHPAAALGLLAAAAVSDLLDGWIARRWHLHTVVGSVLDPMADKVLMTVLTISLAAQGSLPLWLAALVLGRDAGLGVAAVYYRWISLPPPKTFARYWDFSLPSAEVRPTTISKVNTFLQLVLMAATMAATTAAPLVDADLGPALTGLQYLVAGTTVWSGASYVFSKDAVRILTKR